MPLKTEATAELQALIADLRPDRGQLLEALHRMQGRYGYVSAEAMAVVGEQLRLSPAHVYGTTTFYSELRTTPPPPHTIAWCGGAACLLKQSAGMLRALESVLGCALGGESENGRVGLVPGQCNGTCELAPQLWLDGRVVGHVSAARAVRLARALRDGAEAEAALAEIER